MSFKSKNIFRCLLLCVAVVSALVLTACGHHHHHHDNNGTPQSSSSVSLSIDATDFNVNSSARLQTNNDSDFAVSTTGYDNGQLKTTLTDVKAIASGTKYECRISGLINAYDYRFTFKYKGKPVMENLISKSELQNDAVIPVDVNTSIKTLGYDSWLSKSPSNASFENFKNNCANYGITDNFSAFYDPDAYKAILNKIANGENVPLPTKSDVNTDFIPTADAEKEISELLGTWYLFTTNDLPVVVTDKGDVETLVLNSDRTFSWINYDIAECPDNNPEFWQTEKVKADLKGTWKYSNGSLTLNANNSEASVNINVKNGDLIITDSDEQTSETDTSVYKRTKNPYKPTENKALEGSWYLNIEDNKPVVPNSKGKVESYLFNSDGTFTLESYEFNDRQNPEYYQTLENGETIKGTWKYADGKLTLKTDKDEQTFPITLKNAELTITEKDEESSETTVSVFKKSPNSYKPINEAIIGTWYLNSEDNYNVVPNANNEVETWIFKEDGTIELQDYEKGLYPSDEKPEYWKTEDAGDKQSGTWSYKDGKLITLCEGEEGSFSISLEDDVLTITEIDEETSKTTNSVYKRTKPSLK